VTIVVPCFNYGRFLPACVATLLEQSGVEVDVIIVDDASTDGSDEVADELASRHDRVRVMHHSRNAGHIATYNDGLAEATGDYVVLLSSDDLLTPGSLQRATALLEAYPSVGLVYGHPVRFAGDSPPVAQTRPTHWMLWSGHDWLSTRFRRGRNCIISPEVVLRTSILRKIGGFNSDLPHTGDLELWLRAAAVADVGYVGADQAWYREHNNNMHSTVFLASELTGMAVDLGERARTFAAVSHRLGPELPQSDEWLMAARRAIAVEALTLALRPYYWGIAESWPVDDLTALAADVYPDAHRLPHWKAVSVHRRLGAKWRRCDPLSIGHELLLRGQVAAREWRLGHVGL
jgi:glycosyltransferase involved in cell wall biosynthesis